MGSPRAPDESLGSVFTALAANAAIATAKGIAAVLTGSPALVAETLHTIADAGNEVLLYVAIRRSRAPADATHPFGYGPERYYWALLAAIGMFLVGGAVSIWDGIRALLHPPELDAFWVGVVVLVIAFILDGISRIVALRQLRVQAARRELSLRQLLRETADPTVVTIYLEDTIDVLGAVLALAALIIHKLTGSGIADAVASILIGSLLCFIASRLTRRNRALLTNQSVPERYITQMRARLEGEIEIQTVTHLEAVYLGPGEVLVAADVAMTAGLTGGDVATALDRTRAEIARDQPMIARLYLTPVTPPDSG
jgi:cation diffusion facilitator family transporter